MSPVCPAVPASPEGKHHTACGLNATHSGPSADSRWAPGPAISEAPSGLNRDSSDYSAAATFW